MKTKRATRQKRLDATQFTKPGTAASKRGANSLRTPVSEAEMAAWTQQIKDMPDIRWDKVEAMREAIRNNTIDHDNRLADLAKRLSPELVEYFAQVGRQ